MVKQKRVAIKENRNTDFNALSRTLCITLLLVSAFAVLYFTLGTIQPFFGSASDLFTTTGLMLITSTIPSVIILVGGHIFHLWNHRDNKKSREQWRRWLAIVSILVPITIIWVLVCVFMVVNKILTTPFDYWAILLLPIGFVSSICTYTLYLVDRHQTTIRDILSALLLGVIVSIVTLYSSAYVFFVLGVLFSR